MKKIKILLADDHEMVLEGLLALLEGERDIEIVGQSTDGLNVLRKLGSNKKPDILVLDINMPQMDGIEVTVEAKKRYPSTKVLILSNHNRTEFIKKLLAAGADGYILKNSGKDELLKAIREISKGSAYFSHEVMKTDFEQQFQSMPINSAALSAREKEVIKHIANGLSTRQIAEELVISTHTVDSHRKHILSKLNANNSVDITRYALKTGIVKGFDIK